MEFHIVHPQPLLLVSELAEEWDYSEDHVIHLVEAGEIFAFHINRDDVPKHAHYRIVRASAVRGERLTVSGMMDLIATVDFWLLPAERFGRRQTFNVKLCEDALRVSPRHVRELYEANQLGARDLGLGKKEVSLRIPRAALTGFVQRRLRLANNL